MKAITITNRRVSNEDNEAVIGCLLMIVCFGGMAIVGFILAYVMKQ